MVRSVREGKAPASLRSHEERSVEDRQREPNWVGVEEGRNGGHWWTVGRQGLMELGHHWL